MAHSWWNLWPLVKMLTHATKCAFEVELLDWYWIGIIVDIAYSQSSDSSQYTDGFGVGFLDGVFT